jgi:hypothetical protein
MTPRPVLWRGFFGLTAADLFEKCKRDVAACAPSAQTLDPWFNATVSLYHLLEWIEDEDQPSAFTRALRGHESYRALRALCTVAKRAGVTNESIPEVDSWLDESFRVDDSVDVPLSGRFERFERAGSFARLRGHLLAVLREYITYFEQRNPPGENP